MRTLYMFIHEAFCSFLSSVGHCFWIFGVRKGVAILMAILIHYDAIEWCIPHLQNRFLSRSLALFIAYYTLYAIGSGSIYICQLYLSAHLTLSFLFTKRKKKNIIHFVLYCNTEDKLKIFLLNH